MNSQLNAAANRIVIDNDCKKAYFSVLSNRMPGHLIRFVDNCKGMFSSTILSDFWY